MRLQTSGLTTLIALLAATPAFAQGSDTCATAQPIVGTGLFPFDTTAATTDGLPDALCNFFTQPQISNDVWFSWTAPTSASYSFSTCGQTALDTKLAVYDGSCAGTILACSDDDCGGPLQSNVDVITTANNVYIVRLGSYSAGATGTGNVSITLTGQVAVLDTQINPANGHTYHLLAASSWTSAEATAISLGGHLTTVDNQPENEWIRVTWQNYLGSPTDLWIGFNDAAVEGTFAWVDGSPVTYTNWDPGEPNNALTGEDYTNIRRDNATGNWNDLGNAPTGFFNAVHGVVEINTSPVTPACAGDGTGTACPCGNASPVGNNEGCLNSLGTGGKLLGAGVASVASDTLVITGSGMPNSTCLYFQGTTTIGAGAGAVFGDGLRCGGGVVIRLGLKLNVSGVSQYPAAGDPSISTQGLIPPTGGMRTYQCWYRNPATFCTASTFNLTNGSVVNWLP